MDGIIDAYYKIKHVCGATYKYFLYVCKNSDHDWDYSAMLMLLQWKARKMADTIESNGIIVADKHIAKQLRYLVYLIDRYFTEEDTVMEQYYKKYGHPKHGSEPVEGSRHRRLTTEWSSQEAEDQFLPWAHKSWKASQKIKKRIFIHMDRYIERWWDVWIFGIVPALYALLHNNGGMV